MIPRHSFDPATQPHTKRFVVVSHVHIVAYHPEPINKPNSERMTSTDSCAYVGPPHRTTSTQANLTMMHRPRSVMQQTKQSDFGVSAETCNFSFCKSLTSHNHAVTNKTHLRLRSLVLICTTRWPDGTHNTYTSNASGTVQKRAFVDSHDSTPSLILTLRQSRHCHHPDFIMSLE